MKIGQLIFIVFVVKKFSLKTKFILGFYLFILITLVGFPHNTHVIHILNYTRNIIKNFVHTKHKKCSQVHVQSCYQTSENEIVFQKMLFRK